MAPSLLRSSVNRRQFVGALGTLAAAPLLAANRIPIALQLFSVRTQCEQDLEGTLAFVREAGFEGVEFAGFYGRTAAQLKALLDKNGLLCCGSHTPLPELQGDRLERTVENNRALGNHYVVMPGLPKQYEESAQSWKEAAQVLNEVSDKLRPAGMQVGYHNHAIEFRTLDGQMPWAILQENTHPDVIFQLDTGNARIGGADPIELIERYPGREVTVHVKDYSAQKTDPVIGASQFDWKRFADVCSKRGNTKWFIIEHDSPDRSEAKACLDHFRQAI